MAHHWLRAWHHPLLLTSSVVCMQQEKSWNSQQLSTSYDHRIPRAEDRDVTWALTNGQPLGQPAVPTRNTRSSWRDA
jgi:hypothetical protein